EGVCGVTTVLRRIAERTDDLLELADRARPAVRDDERQRLRSDAALVDEVDLEPADLGAELLELVEPRLGRTPVELVAPVRDQLAHGVEVRAVAPARAGDLVGKARAREALAQVRQDGIRNRDAIGLDLHPPRAVTRGR